MASEPGIAAVCVDFQLVGPSSPQASTPRLTARETEVLILIASGKTTKEIAWGLRISMKTAVTHRYNIQQKLRHHNTADLTRAAIRMGLLEP